MKKIIIQLAVVITFAAFGTAVGQVSGDLRNQVLKNDSGKAFRLQQITDGNGKPFAELYVLPGETMGFNGKAEPFAGAGYYQALPDNYYFVQLSSRLLLKQDVGSLRVDKVGWDQKGQLTTITGLRPFLEGTTNIAITSDVKNPKIANGNLYIKLEGHGETEYWMKIQFGKIVAMGKHQDANLAATAKISPNDEPYRALAHDGFSFSIYPDNWEITELGTLSGKLKRFCLVNSDGKEFDLELTHDTVADGRIETKQFGVVIATYQGGYFVFSATEKQIKAIKDFLASQIEK